MDTEDGCRPGGLKPARKMVDWRCQAYAICCGVLLEQHYTKRPDEPPSIGTYTLRSIFLLDFQALRVRSHFDGRLPGATLEPRSSIITWHPPHTAALRDASEAMAQVWDRLGLTERHWRAEKIYIDSPALRGLAAHVAGRATARTHAEEVC